MKKKPSLVLSFIVLGLMISVLGITLRAAAQLEDEPLPDSPTPVVSYATRSDSYGPLRDIKVITPRWTDLIEIPRKMLPNRPADPGLPGEDPVVQGAVSVGESNTLLSFEGVNNVNGVLPPDTQGDVGPNHYVQVVNLSLAIWSKNGTKVYGPANINTLFNGFGGACQTTNDGDPVVLYDESADRWMISQFALPNYPRGPFYECIAISQTPDPTGSYYRYEFKISDNKLDDYPKFGIWPDGYYMAINQFSMPIGIWGGQGVVVFERSKMLAGQTARMVYFDLYSTDSNLGGMLPADWDGAAPPTGAPNPFIERDDNSEGFPQDQLQIWNFHVDWTNPNNSTFTKVQELATAAFDSSMCGGSRNCIPQPGGTNVDAIADRLMYRLQYRNFGTHQAMVVNHTVDVNGSDRAGIRWYELRNTGSGWSIYQQGTFSPDANHRWMGSMAMNGRGEIALGYSISSTTVYPSIRFTGRLPGDPLGQMTLGETTIVNGDGYQGHSSGRWGDYSMMSVDPVDDCTFWYTQEYYMNRGTSNANWQTRIGKIQLQNCELVNEVLPLNAGWNLITLPLEPEAALNAQTLLEDINDGGASCTQVSRWLNGGWETHADGSGSNLFNIELGRGYFVKCTNQVDWALTGSAIESGVTFNLAVGWNLLGIPYPAGVYDASSLLEDINNQGGLCSEVDHWYLNGWEAHLDGIPFNNFALTNRHAYFVYCSQGSTFTPGD